MHVICLCQNSRLINSKTGGIITGGILVWSMLIMLSLVSIIAVKRRVSLYELT